MHIEKDYEEFFGLLNKNKVRYCIVGAYAVAFYSKPRFTKDIDLWIEPSHENAARVIQTLKEFGFGSLKISEKDLMSSGNLIQLGYEPLRVDLLTSLSGVDFAEVWKTRKKGRYGKHQINFIGLNELIKNKRATNRKLDQVDVRELMLVKKSAKKF